MAAKKKSAAKKKTAAASAAMKPPTKSEVMGFIAEDTGLTKKEVNAVFESLGKMIKKNIGSRGPGLFAVPALRKTKVIKKPATKSRKSINPFPAEGTVIKTKPARKVVKAVPAHGLQDM